MIIISLNEAESKDPTILAHVTTLLDALKMHVDFITKPTASEVGNDAATVGNVLPNLPGQSAQTLALAQQAFGQTPPIPAPPTAGAAPSQIAPVAPLGSGISATPPVPPVPAPTAGSAAPVPPASAAPSAPAPAGVTLDKDGVPWDGRIHSSGKTMTGAGVWTKKKGLKDENYITAVKSELRALMAAQAPAAGTVPPVPPVAAPSTPAVPPSPPLPPVSTAAAAPPLPPSGAPSVPPAGGASDAPPVNEFARFLTDAASARTSDEVQAAINALSVPGLVNVMGLAHRPDMIPPLRAALGLAQ